MSHYTNKDSCDWLYKEKTKKLPIIQIKKAAGKKFEGPRILDIKNLDRGECGLKSKKSCNLIKFFFYSISGAYFQVGLLRRNE